MVQSQSTDSSVHTLPQPQFTHCHLKQRASVSTFFQTLDTKTTVDQRWVRGSHTHTHAHTHTRMHAHPRNHICTHTHIHTHAHTLNILLAHIHFTPTDKYTNKKHPDCIYTKRHHRRISYMDNNILIIPLHTKPHHRQTYG